jgi:hypothetical protein
VAAQRRLGDLYHFLLGSLLLGSHVNVHVFESQKSILLSGHSSELVTFGKGTDFSTG